MSGWILYFVNTALLIVIALFFVDVVHDKHLVKDACWTLGL